MEIDNEARIAAVPVTDPQASGAAMKVLVSPDQGWEGYVMRLVEIEPGGYSPRHTHPWPHINYVVAGSGVLHVGGKDTEVSQGAYAYVPSGSLHQFTNTGQEMFRFICIVPQEGHPPPYERQKVTDYQ